MEERKVMNRRWDPIIKLTHWGIVGLIICNALIVGEGSVAHIYAGYFLAGLLVVRLLWGFVGPASARFASFPPSPRRAIAHIGDLLASRKASHAAGLRSAVDAPAPASASTSPPGSAAAGA